MQAQCSSPLSPQDVTPDGARTAGCDLCPMESAVHSHASSTEFAFSGSVRRPAPGSPQESHLCGRHEAECGVQRHPPGEPAPVAAWKRRACVMMRVVL